MSGPGIHPRSHTKRFFMSCPRGSRRSGGHRHGRIQAVNGSARFRKPWVPYLWVGVPLLLVIYFYVYPFFNTLRLSSTDTTPLGEGETGSVLEITEKSSQTTHYGMLF
ncbi:sugar ABC transporter permease [Cutibacterium acnes]|uniref:hypothetical protein n=1 Tax=Cutibacterium acnes TaxID=1747 RepID=UPI0001F0A0E6|nr:hypothetical protein [Cutibacterium acnes]EFT52151.1 hypothetical protein HMPREF9569_02389 [Cutibacterium acnes HL078PA1]EMF64722.1 hypothetical protein TIA1EST31_03123 [Cutibacterium acnes FZ1/2/0]